MPSARQDGAPLTRFEHRGTFGPGLEPQHEGILEHPIIAQDVQIPEF